MIDHPKFEAKDVSALIDFVAEQPEAKLDKPGDPVSACRAAATGAASSSSPRLATSGST